MTDRSTTPRNVPAPEAIRLATDGYRIVDVREPDEVGCRSCPRRDADAAGRRPDAPSRGAARTGTRRSCCTAQSAHARRGRPPSWRPQRLHERGQPRRSIADWRSAGGAWEVPEQLLTSGTAAPLQPPDADPRDRPGRAAPAARLEGAADRRRRSRLAGGALPGGVGDRHHRPGRRRRGRRVEPAAPGAAHRRSHRAAEDRLGADHAAGTEPGDARGRAPRAASARERRAADRAATT